MNYQFVNIDIRQNVATLEIDDPSANTLTYHLLQELEQAFLQVESLQGIKGVILIGKGEKFFSGGVNIGMLLTAGRQHNSHFILYAAELLEYMESSPLHLVTIINGNITGGGLELALIADYRIGLEDNYNIGFPEVRLGVIPGMGGTARLSRLIGSQRALELITQGTFISAIEAYKFGLIDELIQPNEFRNSAIERAICFIESKATTSELYCSHLLCHMQIINDGLIQLNIHNSVANIQLMKGIELHDAASVLLALNQVILAIRTDDDVFAVNIEIFADDFCTDSSWEVPHTKRLGTYVFSRIIGYGRVVAFNVTRTLSPIEVQLALSCDYRLWKGNNNKTQAQPILLNALQKSRYKGYLIAKELHEYQISDLLDSGFYQLGDGASWLQQFVPPRAAGLATGYAKLAIAQGHSLPLEGALLLERHLQEQLFAGPDSREGMKAYLEKRPGQFVGA